MRCVVAIVLACLAVSGVPIAAQTSAGNPPRAGVLSLRWSELAPMIQGQHVTVGLANGADVSGDVVAVRDDALVMDVSRGSLTGGTIPRDSVTTLRFKRSKGSGVRTLGTVIGVLSGVVLGGWASAEAADSAGTGIPLFLGVASGITIAGYYAGKRLDQKETVIQIVP